MKLPQVLGAAIAAGCLAGSGCSASPSASSGKVTPVYDRSTGRLEALVARGIGSGRGETRAEVDGVAVKKVEIDRDGDGRPDRWEYYAPGPTRPDGTAAPNVLVRAEESSRPDGRITRREFYDHGVIQRVEEDTDGDGRTDTWDYYEHGALVRVEIDLAGIGRPTERLLYRADGQLDHIEVDPTGSGTFHATAAPAETHGSGRGGFE